MNTKMNRMVFDWLFILAFVAASSSAAGQRRALRLGPVEIEVAKSAEKILLASKEAGSLDLVRRQATDLWNKVVLTAPVAQPEAFRATYRLAKLVDLVNAAPEHRRVELVDVLVEYPALADELAFTLQRKDKNAKVAGVLLDLINTHGHEKVGAFPGLATAICVVHDEKQTRRVNENIVASAEGPAVFGYFANNARRMALAMDSTPASLLVFVVDATCSPQELAWALDKYQGNKSVGRLFHDIEYDYDHLRSGTQKMVTKQGYTLPNIQQFGGVCADQAHFAVTVGKAIGVPAAYTRASSGTVAHAWVGYFSVKGRNAAWDFTEGRYPEYQNLAGLLIDPQTNQWVEDDTVALRASALHIDRNKRHQSQSLAEAAWTLRNMKQSQQNESFGVMRAAQDVKNRLALLQAAVDLDPACRSAWRQVSQLSEESKLAPKEKEYWAGLISKVAGRRYPGYTFSILTPMIQSVEEAKEQDAYWSRLYNLMKGRPDLQAYTRINQGQMWEKAGNLKKAGWSYFEVISKFPNAGPFVITALKSSEKMLVESGRSKDVLGMYQQAWKAMEKPSQMAAQFASQSNYFKTGKLLAEHQEKIDMTAAAHQTYKAIGLR